MRLLRGLAMAGSLFVLLLAAGGFGTPHLSYSGGPVLSSVKIEVIFWNASVRFQSSLPSFFSTVTESAYFDWLKEYDTPTQSIGRGALDKVVVDTGAPTATTVSDGDIQTELQRLVTAGTVPAPDASTLYFFYFPPGVTISGSLVGTSCVDWCGYHSNTAAGVPYAVIPDMGGGCASGCGPADALGNTTAVSSHEMIEAVTDPQPTSGWDDPVNGEIGDICVAQDTTFDGYNVQLEWSNKNNACIATDPTVTPCSGTLSPCGTACVDLSSDPMNCGSCGTTCTGGLVCNAGSCSSTCAGGLTNCSGSCSDLTTDSANCGSCGAPCAPGTKCSASTCVDACTSTETWCGACVDLMTDAQNCGKCGNVCLVRWECMAGTCVPDCSGGRIRCGIGCYDLTADPNNCGGCGVVCPTGMSCVASKCEPTCTTGQTLCGSTCTDLLTDGSNCGACGTACASGQSCIGGKCTSPCGSGETQCGSLCVDLQTDTAHCGACGTACTAGQACESGRCGAPLGTTCNAASDCASGLCAASPSGGGMVCTQTCTAGGATSCPGGFSCVSSGGQMVCAADVGMQSGGCAAVPERPARDAGGPSVAMLVLLALLVWRVRRSWPLGGHRKERGGKA